MERISEKKFESVPYTGTGEFLGSALDGFMANLPILVCGLAVAFLLISDFVLS